MPPSPLLDQAPIVLTPDGGFFYQPTLVGVMIDLAKLASWEGWTLVVDDNAPERELAAASNTLDECRKERSALCDHLLEMAV